MVIFAHRWTTPSKSRHKFHDTWLTLVRQELDSWISMLVPLCDRVLLVRFLPARIGYYILCHGACSARYHLQSHTQRGCRLVPSGFGPPMGDYEAMLRIMLMFTTSTGRENTQHRLTSLMAVTIILLSFKELQTRKAGMPRLEAALSQAHLFTYFVVLPRRREKCTYSPVNLSRPKLLIASGYQAMIILRKSCRGYMGVSSTIIALME